MMEHLPDWLGRALSGVRAGMEKVAVADPSMAAAVRLDLSSPAFADGGRLPVRFTGDGDGVSPPVAWRTLPGGVASLALLVEDADSPTPQPLVHAVVWGLAPAAGSLAEGALSGGDPTAEIGRNSFGDRAWLPPDPPGGHGEHRYVFQLFALDQGAAPPAEPLGRSSLLAAMDGHVLAAGVLIGTYSRDEPAAIGPAGAVATA